MPPVTRRRTRAITVRWGRPDRAARRAGSGNGLDLALRDLLEGDGQGVLGTGLDERGREVVERALAELVVVVVDLPRPLGGGDHERVAGGRLDVLEQGVDSRPDHRERVVPAAPISPRIQRSDRAPASPP